MRSNLTPQNMKAVILAAGKGARLNSITQKKPKCLINIGGESILERQINAYSNAGIKDIIIVGGYKIKMIKDCCKKFSNLNINIIENIDYESTNNMYSLYLAKDKLEGYNFILSNGDVVCDQIIFRHAVENNGKSLVFYDSSNFDEEELKLKIKDKQAFSIEPKGPTTPDLCNGSTVGVFTFNKEASRYLFENINETIIEKNKKNEWFEYSVNIIFKQAKFLPFDIKDYNWVEIDNIDDVIKADKMFYLKKSLDCRKVFIFDLDGTIYLGDNLIPGVKEFIHHLQFNKKFIYYLSNNSSKSKLHYVQKLRSMGIDVDEENIILSTDGAIHYLLKEDIKDIFIVGTESMRKTFENFGFNIYSTNPKFVVLGYDTELTYSKLRQAALFLQNGAELIATHCDKVCPTPDGPIPDIGSMMALFEVATGKIPIKIFGKPNPEMISPILENHDVNLNEVIIIGDRIYTDMELAKRVGCDFVCVLSGETCREDIEDIIDHPEIVVRNVGDLIEFFA
jgi:HAD superfamily hydrolase (TIGR01450 family)